MRIFRGALAPRFRECSCSALLLGASAGGMRADRPVRRGAGHGERHGRRRRRHLHGRPGRRARRTRQRPAIRWRSGSSASCMRAARASQQDKAKAFGYFSQIADQHADTAPKGTEADIVAHSFVKMGEYYKDGLPEAGIAKDETYSTKLHPARRELFRRRRRAVQGGRALSRPRRTRRQSAAERALAVAGGPQGPRPGAGQARRHPVQRRRRAQGQSGRGPDVADRRQPPRRRHRRCQLDRRSAQRATCRSPRPTSASRRSKWPTGWATSSRGTRAAFGFCAG